MKSSTIFTKKLFFKSLGTLVSFSPLGLIVACGESSQSVTFNREPVLQEIAKVRVATNSNHNSVHWDVMPNQTPSDQVNGFMFLAGDYPSLESAKAAGQSLWTDALPGIVDSDPNKRYVWAKAVLKDGVPMNDDMFFNLTDSSGIREVKVLLDSLSSYRQISLSRIELIGNQDEARVDLSNARLIPGLGVELQNDNIANGAWKPASEFVNLISQSQTITAANFTTVKARVYNNDPTKYVLNTPLSTSNITIKLSYLNRLSLADFEEALNSLTIDLDASNHTSIVYQNLSNVLGVQLTGHSQSEFVSGDYKTEAELIAAGANAPFSKEVPKRTSPIRDNSRNLWLRARVLTSSQGATTGTTYFYKNLTSSTGIRDVKTLVDAIPGFSQTNLSAITFGGVLSNLVFNDSNAILDTVINNNFLGYEFTWGQKKFNSLTDGKDITFAKYVTRNLGYPGFLPADFASLQVRLVVSDATNYILRDAKNATITPTMDFNSPLGIETLSHYFEKWLITANAKGYGLTRSASNSSMYALKFNNDTNAFYNSENELPSFAGAASVYVYRNTNITTVRNDIVKNGGQGDNFSVLYNSQSISSRLFQLFPTIDLFNNGNKETNVLIVAIGFSPDSPFKIDPAMFAPPAIGSGRAGYAVFNARDVFARLVADPIFPGW